MNRIFSLLILTVFLVGVSECRFQLKAGARQRLRQTLQAECTSRGVKKVDEIADKTSNATDCIFEIFNSSKVFDEIDNPTTNEDYLKITQEICKNRLPLTGCVHELLYNMAPCASQSVKDQIEDIKHAVVELFDYGCNDDLAKIRRFLEDKSYRCLRDNGFGIAYCIQNLTEIFYEMPENTKTFEAIDSCHRFDAMKSCLDTVVVCPNASTKEFVDDVLTMIRRGTYCHITVPQPSKEEDNKI